MSLSIHADPVPIRSDADGTLRIAGTRVTLDVIVAQYLAGVLAEEIAERFSVLTPADVHAALAYFLRHREEMECYLAEQAEGAERRAGLCLD